MQALDKLIDNARGFTPEDGEIGIALKRGARELVIEVRNTGPRLPEAMRHRLFDSLVSLRDRSRGADGAVHLGFGLHVVKLVAAAHGGHAEADNLEDGSGVVFRLRLPWRRAPGARASGPEAWLGPSVAPVSSLAMPGEVWRGFMTVRRGRAGILRDPPIRGSGRSPRPDGHR